MRATLRPGGKSYRETLLLLQKNQLSTGESPPRVEGALITGGLSKAPVAICWRGEPSTQLGQYDF